MASSSSGGPSTKPYNVSEIKARLMRPALTSYYICDFTPPTDVVSWLSQRSGSPFSGEVFDSGNKELFQISCSEASLPGSSLNTNEANDDYTGVTQRFAYRRLYDDRSDFTFYVDRNYKVISFFEGWLSYIVGEEGSGGKLYEDNYFYRVRFPEQYRAPKLYIKKFERDSNRLDSGRSLEYQFINAYPISIASMPVSYDSSQLLKCTVSFTYDRYVINKLGPTPDYKILNQAKVINQTQLGPFDTEYALSPVPGQFTKPPGSGGAADLLGGLGGIGVRNPVVR